MAVTRQAAGAGEDLFADSLAQTDPEIFDAIAHELSRRTRPRSSRSRPRTSSARRCWRRKGRR